MKRHPESHLDHALTAAQVDYLLRRFADRDGFFIETITLPCELGTAPCGLYGPIVGDAPIAETEVHYAARGDRAWSSRLVDLPVRQQHEVTVIAGPHERFERWLDDRFAGREVEVWIGFDAAETGRVDNDPNAGGERAPSYGRAPAKTDSLRDLRLAWRWTAALAHAMTHARRVNRFPLVERGLCRCRCEALARRSGHPVPRKSACMGCCYNTPGDWQRVAVEAPPVFAQFVELEHKKPLTKKGRKLSIGRYDSRTQTGTMLPVLVKKPYTPKVKPCTVCGAAARATKAVGCGYLEEGES